MSLQTFSKKFKVKIKQEIKINKIVLGKKNSNKKKEMNIILTVPHDAPVSGEECKEHRYCDSVAKTTANIIQKIFLENGIQTTILIGNINRSILDLNRFESRNQAEFRKKLRLMVNKKSVILDIHSFPNTEKWGFRNSPKAIFLYDGIANDSRLVRAIASKLPYPILKGEKNDIQDEMHEFGLESILLEVNESHLSNVQTLASQLLAAVNLLK